MIHDSAITVILRLIDLIEELPPEKLREIRDRLRASSDSNDLLTSVSSKPHRSKLIQQTRFQEKAKLELIGSVPFILSRKEYFPDNHSVVKFANQLGIDIPNWKTRKRDEIVGRIISEILSFSSDKVARFNSVMNSILPKAERGKMTDFFMEWDKAIREMDLKR